VDIETFWRLNENLPAETAAEVLATRLAELPADEMLSYQRHFYEMYAKAYRWPLWGAAYLIEGGCSDDGFMDFRYGLISRGRHFYETALADPDALAELIEHEDDPFISNESFGYVARNAYRAATGEEMPETDVEFPNEPEGEEWDFDDEAACRERLPKLSARFFE
jgi:hypothetical protein